MRLAIATAAILAHAFPTVVGKESALVDLGMTEDALPKQRKKFDLLGSFDNNGPLASRSKPTSKEEVIQNLKNRFDTRFRGLPEGSECDPDVGILACGMGKVCQPDGSSSMGGVCARTSSLDGRNLEEDYAGILGNYYCEFYNCDCDNWDNVTNTGSVVCTDENACFPEYCGDLCLDFTISYYNTEDQYTLSFCYQATSPYEQLFCFGFDFNSTECYISLDGNDCDHCDLSGSCGL